MPKAIPKSTSGSQVAPGRKRKLQSNEGPSSPPQAMRSVNVGRTVQQRPVVARAVSMSTTIHRTPSPAQRSSAVSSTTSPPEPSRSVAGTSNFLLEALRRIRELQDELDFLQNDPYAEDTDDEGDNTLEDGDEEDEQELAAHGTIGGQRAEAVGWAVCARETMHFLQREGIPPDSPLMVNLRRRLIGGHGDPLPDEGLSC